MNILKDIQDAINLIDKGMVQQEFVKPLKIRFSIHSKVSELNKGAVQYNVDRKRLPPA
jgi:hypothetical protein